MSSWDCKSFKYLKGLGVDCVWYTGIPRHASGKDFVKGDPGSPYAVSDWMDVNPYLADNPDERMAEFEKLVARTHHARLKCIIDFIPNHVAKDYSGNVQHLDRCDCDWTDTLKVDWNDKRTGPAMLEILRFWASKGVDGFRCDMVEMVPQKALKELISSIKEEYPGLIFIAEVYGKENYRSYLDEVGFDMLYDKSGYYDKLRSIICSNTSARELTWHWQWLGDMQGRMLNFLENHDEQRTASSGFAGGPQETLAAAAFSMLFNTASFMLYFGQEAGENAAEDEGGRTSIFNWCEPETVGRLGRHIENGKGLRKNEEKILSVYKKLTGYAKLSEFASGNTWDLCYCQSEDSGFNPDNQFAFLRYSDKSAYLVLCNFSDEPAVTNIYVPSDPLGREFRVKMAAKPRNYSITKML